MENLTFKEILLSVAVIAIALAIAIFINPFIKDSMLDDVRRHQNALQVTDNPQQFQYACTTKVGDVFGYGTMTALHPTTFPELINVYAVVEKTTERYTQHTRTVCDARDKKGNCISSHIEIYYTWDSWKHDTVSSDYFDFLSVTFPYNSLPMSVEHRVELSQSTVTLPFLDKVHGDYIYEDGDTWNSVGDLRYYYDYLPTSFHASLLVNFSVDGITPIKFYYEKNQDQVFEQKEHSLHVFDLIYYTAVILIIGGTYYYFAYNEMEIE